MPGFHFGIYLIHILYTELAVTSLWSAGDREKGVGLLIPGLIGSAQDIDEKLSGNFCRLLQNIPLESHLTIRDKEEWQ